MKQRIAYLDISKGILISLMVLGHIFLEGPVRQFIYAFHMPGFLIISGILFSKTSSLNKPIHKFILSRLYSLIVPFVFFELIGVITDIICNGLTLNPVGYLYNTLTQNWNNGPDGFLLHLFGAELLFFITYKIFKNNVIRCSIGIATMITAFLLPGNLLTGQMVIFRVIGIYFGFITIGYFFFTIEKLSRKFMIIVSLIITVAVSIFGIYISNTYGNILNTLIYFTGALFGSYFIIEISKLIHFKPLIYLGMNSLIVMGTHNLMLLPARTYIPNAFSIPVEILLFILIILAEFPLCFVFNKFIPFFVGKKKAKTHTIIK